MQATIDIKVIPYMIHSKLYMWKTFPNNQLLVCKFEKSINLYYIEHSYTLSSIITFELFFRIFFRDCGVYVASYAEFLSERKDIPADLNLEEIRLRYGALLWN